jgi:hypothetical protein
MVTIRMLSVGLVANSSREPQLPTHGSFGRPAVVEYGAVLQLDHSNANYGQVVHHRYQRSAAGHDPGVGLRSCRQRGSQFAVQRYFLHAHAQQATGLADFRKDVVVNSSCQPGKSKSS